MTSRVLPRCKCAEIMQGLWHLFPLEGCQMCLSDVNGPTSSAPDLTCWEVANAPQHCTAVLHYFKSCFYVVSADLDWAEVELPGLVRQNHICVTIPQWEPLCKYTFNGCTILIIKTMVYLAIPLLLSKWHFPIICFYKNYLSEHISTGVFVPFHVNCTQSWWNWMAK